tara:strand:+ start:9007 stop:9255 length:249 start_codon:yes stop_codon:yes gene_type:complete
MNKGIKMYLDGAGYVNVIASDGDKFLFYEHGGKILFEKACYFRRSSQVLKRDKTTFSQKLLRGDLRTQGVPIDFNIWNKLNK